MKKVLLTLLMSVAAIGGSASTPLWLSDVKISPDGSEIVFCYKGDIYKVSASGGSAVQLTSRDSYECEPVWSPDGKKIAFASDRNGNFDLFVMPSSGGAAKRITFDSASELPSTFSPDGKYVYFSATIQDPVASVSFPTTRQPELYKVPVDGGRSVQVLATPAEKVAFDKTGDTFLYQDQKGFENEWRKHHTSSITRDVWMYDTKTGKHTNLTSHAGEDRNPVYSPDGKDVYFLSERNGGSFNVYRMAVSQPAEVKAVTKFKTHPVRFLSVAGNGMLCYAYDGEIYTQNGVSASPRKVKIDLVCDDDSRYIDRTYTSGLNAASVSPDGKQVAFIVRGEVFVTSVEYPTTKRITETPEAEKSVTWADNRTIAYASERGGKWGLYKATIAREEDLNFPNATIVNEEALIPSDKVERAYPQFSPDGKELAFIEDRNRLMVLNLKTKKVRQVTDGSYWMRRTGAFDYSWSPDGKWFALEVINNGHDPYSNIAIVSADGGEVINITNNGYFNSTPQWVLDGNAVMFITDRYGMRSHASWGSLSDVMLVFMNQDAYDKYNLSKEDYELRKELDEEREKKAKKEKKEDKKDNKKTDKKEDKKADDKKEDSVKPIVVELAGIEDRLVRVTPNSSEISHALITKDGKSLYYLSEFEDGYDLWKMDLRKKETKIVQKLGAGPGLLVQDFKGKNIFLFTSRSVKKIDSSSDKATVVTYNAKMRIDLAAEREYMFNHICLQEKECFYNTNMHGVDWEAMCKAYRKFLPHINNNYDFSKMVSELLGELNVSHTGCGYRAPGGGDRTLNLGLIYDLTYTGKGLKVDEVVEKGPFDYAKSKVKPGVIVEKINGEEIGDKDDVASHFTNLQSRKNLVSLYDPATGERWDEVVVPISAGAMRELLYKRWVKRCAAEVDRLSGGRLAYVHIESMDDESFRTIYGDLLGKYYKKEGVVIDTRWNGGGRLHEDIEVLFSGKKYFTQVVRGKESCDMPSRRWNKPSIMVQCEANYSNAHGTPWVYKHCGIGRLVGMPVPGTMTSVSWETLIDPTLYFGIPVIGYRLPDGSYLENSQLEPDVKVSNSPETIVKGEDTQLRVAVEQLLREIDGK